MAPGLETGSADPDRRQGRISPDCKVYKKGTSWSSSNYTPTSDTNSSRSSFCAPLKYKERADSVLSITRTVEETQKRDQITLKELSHLKRTIVAELKLNVLGSVDLDVQLQKYECEVGKGLELRKGFHQTNLEMNQAERSCADATIDLRILGKDMDVFHQYVTNLSKKLTILINLLHRKRATEEKLAALQELFNRVPALEKELVKMKNLQNLSIFEADDHNVNDNFDVVIIDQSKRVPQSSIVTRHGGTENLMSDWSFSDKEDSAEPEASSGLLGLVHELDREHLPLPTPTFTCAWAYPPLKGSKHVRNCGKTFYSIAALRKHQKNLEFGEENSHYHFNVVQGEVLKLDHLCGISLVRGGNCKGIAKQENFAIRKHYGEAAHVIDFILNSIYCFVCKKQYSTKGSFLQHLETSYVCFSKVSERDSKDTERVTSLSSSNTETKAKIKQTLKEFKQLVMRKGKGKAEKSEALYQRAFHYFGLMDEAHDDEGTSNMKDK